MFVNLRRANKYLIFMLILSSCSNKLIDQKEVKQIVVNQKLEVYLRNDLNCFRKAYPNINSDSISFDIYAEKLDSNEMDIALGVSCILKIDTNCLGVFYIDSFVYTVYGEFSEKLYSYSKDNLFFSKKIFEPDLDNNDKSAILNCLEY